MNVNLECTLSTIGLSYMGGYMFSHHICTDPKNGKGEVQNHWKIEKAERGRPLSLFDHTLFWWRMQTTIQSFPSLPCFALLFAFFWQSWPLAICQQIQSLNRRHKYIRQETVVVLFLMSRFPTHPVHFAAVVVSCDAFIQPLNGHWLRRHLDGTKIHSASEMNILRFKFVQPRFLMENIKHFNQKNEATWFWSESTCLWTLILPWPMWPLTLIHVAFDLNLETFDLQVTCQTHHAKSMKLTFLI